MNKPHIKKLSKGSKIFECVSRFSARFGYFSCVEGHGYSPFAAFESWRKRRDFLIKKYTSCGPLVFDGLGNSYEALSLKNITTKRINSNQG